VYGTGGSVSSTTGQVGLQLTRASAALDIARVAAHEDADGFSGLWNVSSFAVCAVPVVGLAPANVLETNTVGTDVACPAGRKVHSAGGGAGNGSGAIFLQVVYPSHDLDYVIVVMTASPATGVMAQAICA
jgi:hypothetical protein